MQIKTHELKNGVRIVSVFMPDSLSQTTMILQRVGSNNESESDAGIAHFLEHMCFKGTHKRPSALLISRQFDALGAQTNAFTTNQFTGYYAKTAKADFVESLDVLADIYLNSTFPSAELEKEKGVIVDEIKMYLDEPKAKVDWLFDELVFAGQPAGRRVIGYEPVVRSMTRERMLAWHKDHYSPEGTVVVVAGGVPPETIFPEVEKHFFAAGNSEPVAVREIGESAPGRVRLATSKGEQLHLLLGARSLGQDHPDRYPAAILATILGGNMSSRLFQRVREELGYGYYVYAAQSGYEGYGSFFAGTGIDPKGLPAVLPAMVEEFVRIVQEPVSALELDLAKKYRNSSVLMGLEDNEQVAMFYGVSRLFDHDLETPSEISAKIEAVSIGDVQRVANDILKPGNLRLAAVGPLSDPKELEKYLP